MSIRFRPWSKHRPFELEALEYIKRPTLAVFGESVYEIFFENLEISSHGLYGGTDISDLSVLFRSMDAGGSGATYRYVLALKIKGKAGFIFGLYFDTDEAGKVSLTDTNTESRYSVIMVNDRQLYTQYSYNPDLAGYEQDTGELAAGGADHGNP